MAEHSPAATAAMDSEIPSAPSSGNSKPMNKAAAQAAQMNKLRDANSKYKNLLKMAKERIQQQEEELEQLRRTSDFCIVLPRQSLN